MSLMSWTNEKLLPTLALWFVHRLQNSLTAAFAHLPIGATVAIHFLALPVWIDLMLILGSCF